MKLSPTIESQTSARPSYSKERFLKLGATISINGRNDLDLNTFKMARSLQFSLNERKTFLVVEAMIDCVSGGRSRLSMAL